MSDSEFSQLHGQVREHFIQEQVRIADQQGEGQKSGRLEGYWEGRKLNKVLKNILKNEHDATKRTSSIKSALQSITSKPGGELRLQKLIRWLDEKQILSLTQVVSAKVWRGAFVHARQTHTQNTIISGMKGSEFRRLMTLTDPAERASLIKECLKTNPQAVAAFFSYIPVASWIPILSKLDQPQAQDIMNAILESGSDRDFISNLGKIVSGVKHISDLDRQQLLRYLPKDPEKVHAMLDVLMGPKGDRNLEFVAEFFKVNKELFGDRNIILLKLMNKPHTYIDWSSNETTIASLLKTRRQDNISGNTVLHGLCLQARKKENESFVVKTIEKMDLSQLEKLLLVKNKAGKTPLDLFPAGNIRDTLEKTIGERLVDKFFTTTVPHSFKSQLDTVKLKILTGYGYTVATPRPGSHDWSQDLQTIVPQPLPEAREILTEQFAKLDRMLAEVQKQHAASLRSGLEGVAPSALFERLQNLETTLKQRIEHENAQYSAFIDVENQVQGFLRAGKGTNRKELYPGVDPRFLGSTSSELYADSGVCLGACYHYAAQKIRGVTEFDKIPLDSIQPTAQARTLEAGHTLKGKYYVFRGAIMNFNRKFREYNRDSQDLTNLQKCDRLLEVLPDIIFGLSVKGQQLKDAIFAVSDTKEQFKGTIRDMEKLIQNMKTKSLPDSEFQTLSQALYGITDRLLDMYNAAHESYIDDTFLRRLQVNTQEIPLTPKVTLDSFINNLESTLPKLHLQEGGHAILSLFGSQTQVSQAGPAKPIESELATSVYQELCVLHNILPVPTSNEAAFQAIQALPSVTQKSLAQRFLQEKLNSFVSERVISRIGTNAPSQIAELIDNEIKNDVNRILRSFDPTVQVSFEARSGHAIYVRFKDGDYEIQDVNYPGFTGFRTKNLNELKMYLAFWCARHSYTHIDKVISVGARPEVARSSRPTTTSSSTEK